MDGVSVCIIARNEERSIERCLKSLTAPPHPWEIVVIDNLSQDQTRAVVRRFAGQHPYVRLYQSGGNNLARSRNLALQVARFPLVAFIDADCEAPPDWLTNMVCRLRQERLRDSRVVAVGGGQQTPGGEHPFYAALQLFLSSRASSLGASRLEPQRRVQRQLHLPTCNLLMVKEVALQVKGFDPHFSQVCEDVDLGWRLHRHGFVCVSVLGLDVVHHHDPRLSTWARKIFRYSWGQMLLLRRHGCHRNPLLLTPLGAGLAWLTSLAIAPWVAVFALTCYTMAVGLWSFSMAYRAKQMAIVCLTYGLFILSHSAAVTGQLWALCQWLIPWAKLNSERFSAVESNGCCNHQRLKFRGQSKRHRWSALRPSRFLPYPKHRAES